MFRISLEEFKSQQAELHRRADHYRLVKSVEKSSPVFAKARAVLGRMLIQSGEVLISRVQEAH